MADRNRNYLKQRFDNGETPSGEDFADFLDSFLNKEDDKVRLVAGDNLSIPAGIILSNAAAGAEGALRFNGAEVQVFRAGSWQPIAGPSGAFHPVEGETSVAFDGGNVGIGSFAAGELTHKLDVELGANSNPDRRVRLGNLAVHNGTANDAAYISNANTLTTTDKAFALRQDGIGSTTVNAAINTRLMLAQDNEPKLSISTSGNINMTPTGNVFIGSELAGQNRNLVVSGNVTLGALAAVGSPPLTPPANKSLIVHGEARKTGGGGFDPILSDIRVKKDIRPIQHGLREICGLNPVFYKFNGEAGTPNDGKEYAGLIAQELKEVLPFMIKKSEVASAEDKEKRDLLTYDSNPLMFIMINAIRELTERVEELESELKAIKKATPNQ